MLSWALAPACEDTPRAHAVASAALRILLGLLWLYNVAWKRAPDFGREAGNGLYKFTSYAVEYPVFPPYSWVVENIVLEVFTPFGWLVLLSETALAVMLLTGTYVRLAALIGIGQSIAIGLSVAYAPEEWPWAYWLMIGAHTVILFSAAGRYAATDAVRAGKSTGNKVGFAWGIAAVLVGLYSVFSSFGDPLARSGPGIFSADPSISFGRYNLLGGLVLVAAGTLLVVAARTGKAKLGIASAALSALAALSLYAQLGFSDPVLGGNATSAAVFVSVAVIAIFTARPGHHDPHGAARTPATSASPV